MAEYTLSDYAAVSNNDGFNGGNCWVLILLFAMIFGGGNGLWGNSRGYGDYGNFASAASQQEILFGQQFSNLDNKIDRIGNGIADATFALNNNLFGVQTTLNSTIGGVGTAVTNEGRNIQMQIATTACDNQKNVDALRYDMANYAAVLNSNIDNKFAALEKSQLEQKIADQSQQISQLQMAQAMCGVPKISTYAWGTYPYQAPCGCGCNSL